MIKQPKRPRCEVMVRLAKTMTYERQRQETRAAWDGLNPFICREPAYFVSEDGHFLYHRHANRAARGKQTFARLEIN